MKKLGIAIYPQKATLEENLRYLKRANEAGFSRLFLSLLEIDAEKELVLQLFKETIDYAKRLGFFIILDVNPALFSQLSISYEDLIFFENIGVDGIRLDLGFSGSEEAYMTKNPYNLKIEINMSHGTKYVDNIISRAPLHENLIGSHNFYPHKYTGLDYDYFLSCCEHFKKYNLKTSAFVTSQKALEGPWPINDKICTIEEHRELPLSTQVKSMIQSGLIDTIIIGNAFASEEELIAAGNAISSPHLQLDVKLHSNLTDLEKDIILNGVHTYRGEKSPYVIRTKSESRKRISGISLPPQNTVDILPGDVIIDNEQYGQYKGELQIACKQMKNDGRVNVVGAIPDYEQILLRELKPWSTFVFNAI